MTSDRINEIYKMLVDSQKGYAEAAEIADDPAISQMFSQRAHERQMLIARFPLGLDGQASNDGGSVAGAAHRLFINLRRMVQDDTKVALAEVERGESTFLEAIDSALDDDDLVGADRQLMSDLREQVMDDRNEFAGLHARY